MFKIKPAVDDFSHRASNFTYICITQGKVTIQFAAISAQKWKLFPRVIQIYTKFANFTGLYFPYFTTFRHQTLPFVLPTA